MNEVSTDMDAETAVTVPFNSKAHSKEIDSLRAVASLLVFAFHAHGVFSINPESLDEGSNLFMGFIVTGATGVTLFFIISSFLLSMPFFSHPNPDRIRFYKKRFLRTMPLYYITVIVASIATSVLINNPAKLPQAFLLLFGAWDFFPWSFPWWSLRTEIQFYILLPLLMPLIHCRNGRWLLVLCAFLYFCGGIIFFRFVKFSDFYLIMMQSALGHGPTFLMGIVTAFVYMRYGSLIKKSLENNKLFRYGLSDFIIIILIVSLGCILKKVAVLGGMVKAEVVWPVHYIYESIIWCAILISIIVIPSKLKILFSNRYMAKFGIITFSFYLVHLPILFYVKDFFLANIPSSEKGWNPLAIGMAVVSFIIASFVSILLYNYVEKPILQLKDKL